MLHLTLRSVCKVPKPHFSRTANILWVDLNCSIVKREVNARHRTHLGPLHRSYGTFVIPLYKIQSILQSKAFAKHILGSFMVSVIGGNWICRGGKVHAELSVTYPFPLAERKQVSLHILQRPPPGWNGRQRCADCLVTTIH